MLGKVLALSTLCAFALLSALMQSSSPATIHPLGILLVFILLYMVVLGVLTFLMAGAWKAIRRLRRQSFREDEPILQRSYIYASVLALAPVMLVGMRSIGHAGLYETLLVIAFEVMACFYIARRR